MSGKFKKMICLFCFVVVLFLAADVQASITWTNAAGDQLWNTPENWSKNRLPVYTDEVDIGLSPGPIILDDVAVELEFISLGYDNFTGELTMDGGALTARTFLLGYGEGSKGTLNMNNGVLTVGRSLNLGGMLRGSGVLNMTGGTTVVEGTFNIVVGVLNMFGGTIVVKGMFRVGDQVNLDGGVIATNGFSLLGVGSMNIKAGTLIINRNETLKLQTYIDNGWITAYEGQGILELGRNLTNEGKTTLKAVHMLNPNPVYGSNVVSTKINQLQWTLPEPNQPGGVVFCDVYFGANPDVEKNPKIVEGQAIESVSVSLVPNVIYYWAVNLYDSSISATEPYMLSSVFTFDTLTVNAGPDVATWLANGLRIGNLDATVTDFFGPFVVEWTVLSEPNDSPGPNAVITDPSAEDTSITLTALGKYILQLRAFNSEFTGSDTITINVYSDSCEAAQSLPDYLPLVGNLNMDCWVDEIDLALLEQNLFKDNYLVGDLNMDWRVDEIDLALLEENWLKDNSLIEEWFTID